MSDSGGNASVPNWWDAPISQHYGAATDIYFSNGAQDIEKGNVYSIKAGTPVNLPIPGKIVWEDAQHAVVQTAHGFLNFLHLNPTLPVGTRVPAGGTIGQVSNLVGNSGTLPDGHFYIETGNVLEVGLYKNQSTAISRDNYVDGVDQPHNFTNIENPNALFSTFPNAPEKYQPVITPPRDSNNGDIVFHVGPWTGDIPNPVAPILNGVQGTVTGAEKTIGDAFKRYSLAVGLAIAGFVLVVIALRKPIASMAIETVAPEAKTAEKVVNKTTETATQGG